MDASEIEAKSQDEKQYRGEFGRLGQYVRRFAAKCRFGCASAERRAHAAVGLRSLHQNHKDHEQADHDQGERTKGKKETHGKVG